MDVESLAGHLLPAGSVFRFLAEHRHRLFPDALFADLFPSGRGRPSIPGEVIASVIVLQALNGLSDREAVEALTFDLRWKAACGYPVDKKAFDASSLTVWRARLAASERPQRIFEVVRDVIDATGAVKGRTRRALDSTILDDAVARQDTVTQLIAQVRRVGREVPGAQQVIEQRCTRLAALTGQGYDSTGKPRIAWDDRQARDELVTALVNDALALLAAWTPKRSRLLAASRPRRSRCSPWWPVRMLNQPRVPSARMAGGGSPAGSPRTGSSQRSTLMRGMRTRPWSAARTGSRPTW